MTRMTETTRTTDDGRRTTDDEDNEDDDHRTMAHFARLSLCGAILGQNGAAQ